MVKSMWHEDKGVELYRKSIGDMYIFIHFITPVVLYIAGKAIAVQSGGCIFFEANSEQHFASPDCELIHDWFHADISCGALMEKYGLMPNTVYYPGDTKEITDIINEIEIESIKKNYYYQELLDSLAHKLFVRLARAGTYTKENADETEERKKLFLQIRSTIHAEYNREWSVTEMAKIANLSESRFYSLYKKIFGISPIKDLCITRIHRAQVYLLRGNVSVESVAELCGYNNVYHFIRQFKEFSGITPGKFISKVK